MEGIIAAFITGVLALVGVVITVVGTVRKANSDLLSEIRKQSELDDQKLNAKLERFQAATDTKIDELTREVREHNNFARRLPVVENDIKTIYKRLDGLENDGK
jgi:hypothetical protein